MLLEITVRGCEDCAEEISDGLYVRTSLKTGVRKMTNNPKWMSKASTSAEKLDLVMML